VGCCQSANTATGKLAKWPTDQSFNNTCSQRRANNIICPRLYIKIDVTELSTGNGYYYRFPIGDKSTSPVGVTKTFLAKQIVSKITFAVSLVQTIPQGYFYANIPLLPIKAILTLYYTLVTTFMSTGRRRLCQKKLRDG